MKTFFCRHSSALDIDQKSLQFLWEGNYMAIHYPDTNKGWDEEMDAQSIIPNDYKSTIKGAFNTLHDIANNGGYVFSSYENIDNYKIGYVEPNTKIELISGTWGSKNGNDGRKAILKALKFKNSVEINPIDALSLTCAQPRQGTICVWSSIGKRVYNLYNNINVSKTLNDLTPDLQEVLCSEFLRLHIDSRLPKVVSLLTPVGRTMKDVDIIGLSSIGKRVLVQVTYDFEPRWKIDRLEKYGNTENCNLILFCRTKQTKMVGDVFVYSIEEAFTLFTETEIGKNWIREIK